MCRGEGEEIHDIPSKVSKYQIKLTHLHRYINFLFLTPFIIVNVCIYFCTLSGTLSHRTDLVQVISLGKNTIFKHNYTYYMTFKESSTLNRVVLLRSQQEPSEGFFFFTLYFCLHWVKRTQDMESEKLEWNIASATCYIILTNFEFSELCSFLIYIIKLMISIPRWKHLTNVSCSLKYFTIYFIINYYYCW